MRTLTTMRAAVLTAVCGLALGAAAPTALAQNALGDGRALDRNLQPGTGGINTRVRDYEAQIQYQNALVTGNVPGGRAFRGNVGYLAPGDFRGSLGSDDLFVNRRETVLSSAAAASGLRSPEALRYQFGATAGGVTAGQFQSPLLYDRAGIGATGADVSSGLRSTSHYLSRQALRPVIVGVGPTRTGQEAAIAASPLLGLRQFEVPIEPDPVTGTFGRPQGPRQLGSPETGPLPEERARPDQLSPELGQQLTGLLPRQTPGTGVPREGALPGNGVGGLRADQDRLLTGFEPVPRGVRPPTRAGAGAVQGEVNLAAPSLMLDQRSTAYADVMDQLREQLAASVTPETPEERPLTIQEDLDRRLGELRERLNREREMRQPPREIPGLEDEQRTPEERERAERRREALRQAGLLDPMRAGLDPRTVETIRRSRTRVDNLATPTVADNLVYAENMAVGQNLLGEERYFDAEERFSRAAAAVPGDVMAQVGRVHAQIGAGLYMSAAMNLRSILTTHPELTATQYGEQLLPRTARWRAIAEQLRERMGGEEPVAARSSAILLAYLGYQMGDRSSTAEGLRALRTGPEAELPSEQAFVALLEAVWLDPALPLGNEGK